MAKKIHYSDYLEETIGDLLTKYNIRFIHESQGAALDFYLPDHDIHIEVKQFHADRVLKQLAAQDNVILIQGRKSIEFLKTMLNG